MPSTTFFDDLHFSLPEGDMPPVNILTIDGKYIRLIYMTPQHARLIKLPVDLWQLLDADAERCKRSSLKQLEAILTVYYKLADIELRDVKQARDLASPDLAKQPPNGVTRLRKRA